MDDFDFDRVDFITSDTHFGHANIIRYESRPFEGPDEMDEALIARWNAVVGPQDVVLHLGDLALGRFTESVATTARLNGRRLLVPGNHDRIRPLHPVTSDAAAARYRAAYEDAGWRILPGILSGTRHGRRVLASHFPYEGDSHDEDRFTSLRPVDAGLPLLHGHIHSRGGRGGHGRLFHVGTDSWDYTPVAMREVDHWLAGLAE